MLDVVYVDNIVVFFEVFCEYIVIVWCNIYCCGVVLWIFLCCVVGLDDLIYVDSDVCVVQIFRNLYCFIVDFCMEQ